MQTAGRRASIIKHFDEQAIDALIVVKRENIYYLSGFTGTHGLVLVTRRKTILFTDSRYSEQARCEVDGRVSVVLSKNSLFKDCVEYLVGARLLRAGVESQAFSLYQFSLLTKAASRKLTFVRCRRLVESSRAVKDADEIRAIRASYAVLGRMVGLLRRLAFRGYTEQELSAKAALFLLSRQLGDMAFDPIIVTAPRSSMPHARPTKALVRKNDVLLVDVGSRVNRYNSDLTRNFVFSRMPTRQEQIYRIVASAQREALTSIRPGMRACDIDAIARDSIRRSGYGDYFGHSLGHGIGLEVHEEPFISPVNQQIITEGMVFTVEPGIYLPRTFGVRIEDAVLVTKKGCEVLSDDIH